MLSTCLDAQEPRLHGALGYREGGAWGKAGHAALESLTSTYVLRVKPSTRSTPAALAAIRILVSLLPSWRVSMGCCLCWGSFSLFSSPWMDRTPTCRC